MTTLIMLWVLGAQDNQPEEIERMVQKLDQKIVTLIEKLSARGEEERVKRLRGAHEKLKGDGLAERLLLLKTEWENGRLEEARAHAERAMETLKEIVRILEQAADDTAADIEWLEGQLRKVQKLLPRQKHGEDPATIEDETRTIEKDLNRRGFPDLGKLGDDAARAVRRSQNDGSKGLEKLRDGIQKAIDDLKNRQKTEDRIHLAEELGRVLAVEKAIRKATGELGGGRVLDRAQVLRAKRLSSDQSSLREKMAEIRKAVALENADVFEFVIDMIGDEMNEIASRLNNGAVGRDVQDLEDSVVRRLSDLIEAFQTPHGKPGGGDGPGGDQPSKPPLVPDVAQLNLMKKLQEAILQKTTRVRVGENPYGEIEQRVLRRLSEEQRKLAELMGEYIRRFEGEKRRDENQGISFETHQDEPPASLEGIRRLMGRSEDELNRSRLEQSERTQKDVIDRMMRLICDSKTSRESAAPAAPPATDPNDAKRVRGSIFSGPRGWKPILPPHERPRMIVEMGRRDLYLPEYQDQIREFMQRLMVPETR